MLISKINTIISKNTKVLSSTHCNNVNFNGTFIDDGTRSSTSVQFPHEYYHLFHYSPDENESIKCMLDTINKFGIHEAKKLPDNNDKETHSILIYFPTRNAKGKDCMFFVKPKK